jgi:hypothetical protein
MVDAVTSAGLLVVVLEERIIVFGIVGRSANATDAKQHARRIERTMVALCCDENEA